MSLDNTTGELQGSPSAQDVNNVDSSTTQEQEVQKVPLERLQQVVAQKNENAREIEALRNELQEVRAQQAQVAPVDKTLESFGYNEDAFEQYQKEQERASIRDEVAANVRNDLIKQQEEQRANEQLSNYNQKHAEYAAKTESYASAEQNMVSQGMQFSPLVAKVVLKTNNPAVQHALMNNLPGLHSLNQLSDPTDVALAIGRIETNLQKPVSSAPDPAPSVGDGSSTSSSSIENMSMDDYARFRRNGN
ncbi:MAG: hypothetical protein CMI54_01730 [Parcubacteria group bacterium]|nr:hypothetical protein [Parcubacteria group bacterium]|tara:strand:- start:12478 stop:13221 length:744 start_codon:yes stop_codon:yes gene_type:complete